ncbi:MAG: histidine phosphatase family protein [Melioribacteraceae bacterium]|nr:histidine phosphatase family protein [Melioribacteraceae bacterium]
MNLYLMRHGEAEIQPGKNEKALTESGKSKIRSLTFMLNNYIHRLDYVLSSNLERAKETADIMRRSFNLDDPAMHDISLNPGALPEDIIVLVNSLDAKNILLVFHEPDISRCLSAFIGDGYSKVNYQPATIAKISFDREAKLNNGRLEFIIPTVG